MKKKAQLIRWADSRAISSFNSLIGTFVPHSCQCAQIIRQQKIPFEKKLPPPLAEFVSKHISSFVKHCFFLQITSLVYFFNLRLSLRCLRLCDFLLIYIANLVCKYVRVFWGHQRYSRKNCVSFKSWRKKIPVPVSKKVSYFQLCDK